MCEEEQAQHDVVYRVLSIACSSCGGCAASIRHDLLGILVDTVQLPLAMLCRAVLYYHTRCLHANYIPLISDYYIVFVRPCWAIVESRSLCYSPICLLVYQALCSGLGTVGLEFN